MEALKVVEKQERAALGKVFFIAHFSIVWHLEPDFEERNSPAAFHDVISWASLRTSKCWAVENEFILRSHVAKMDVTSALHSWESIFRHVHYQWFHGRMCYSVQALILFYEAHHEKSTFFDRKLEHCIHFVLFFFDAQESALYVLNQLNMRMHRWPLC